MDRTHSFSIGNAAGTIKQLGEAVDALECRRLTDLTLGTYTRGKEPGNTGTTYHYDARDRSSVNAKKLPNQGIEEAAKFFPEIVKRAKDTDTNVIASIWAETPAGFGELAYRCRDAGIHRVELDVDCPNARTRDGKRFMLSYRPDMLDEVLYRVRKDIGFPHGSVGNAGVVGVKVALIEQTEVLKNLAPVLWKDKRVDFVVACQGRANQWMLNPDGTPRLDYHDGRTDHNDIGALGGDPVRKTAVGVCSYLSRAIQQHGHHVDTYGCGGIFTGLHAFEFYHHGKVEGIRCATAIIEGGIGVLNTIATDFVRHSQTHMAGISARGQKVA